MRRTIGKKYGSAKDKDGERSEATNDQRQKQTASEQERQTISGKNKRQTIRNDKRSAAKVNTDQPTNEYGQRSAKKSKRQTIRNDKRSAAKANDRVPVTLCLPIKKVMCLQYHRTLHQLFVRSCQLLRSKRRHQLTEILGSELSSNKADVFNEPLLV